MALNPPGNDPPGNDPPEDQQAVAALTRLHQATAALADQLADQSAQPPAGFVDSVMAHVRAQPRPRRHLPLPSGRPGRLSITEHAAATLLSCAADTVHGATSLRCTFFDLGDPTQLHLSISLAYGQHALTTADQVRAAVHAAAHTQLSLHLRRIDITIDDIHPHPATQVERVCPVRVQLDLVE